MNAYDTAALAAPAAPLAPEHGDEHGDEPGGLLERRDHPRPPEPHRTPLGKFWHALGPGVITGAADDDPSGIATYSVAGAQFGTAFLWIAVVTWPLMAAVQTMCARIGMVTGRGLTAALEKKFPRPVLAVACVALLAANALNIGADLAGMADAAELLTGVNSHLWVVVFAIGIGWATVRLRYAVVAILGTTISPYLFFWQASQEVEEEKALGRHSLVSRIGASADAIVRRKIDVGVGTFFSNVAMFFIVLTTALTLHRAGITHVDTSRQVADALRPLAGRWATLLYTVGLIGTGALAIPTLAGSAAYAFAELFGWREGMDEHFRGAPAFYAVILLSLLAGVGMDFANVNVVAALYWSAVLNGLLAPFLLTGILVAASDRTLMHGQPSSWLGRVVVGVTTVAMFGAAVGMFVV